MYIEYLWILTDISSPINICRQVFMDFYTSYENKIWADIKRSIQIVDSVVIMDTDDML